jgi:hypothetical protein
MYQLHMQIRQWAYVLAIALFSTASPSVAQPRVEQDLRSGFALAQDCEKEIDDDMAFYEECIGHAVDRVIGKTHVILGLHFQAWLMADLAARQDSPRALSLRKRHQQGLQQQLNATGIKLSQLCRAKKLSCATVRSCMGQRFE